MTDNDTQNTEAIETAENETEEEAFSFVEDPEFTIDYKGDCYYEVKVSIPVANEAKQTEELFDELVEEIELPGFRRGRAPRRLVEKKFTKHVKKEVTEKLVGAAFEKLVEDEKLRPSGQLDIDGLDGEDERGDGDPLAFTLKFEVGPRVELGKYRGVAVERPVLKVADKDIKENIENLRSRYAVFETMKRGKAKKGDQVVIDFKGTIDGESFPGGDAEGYPYILGSHRFFGEFEEALTGAKAGDEMTCEVTFPEDYSSEAVRGKTAQFSITAHEVKRRNVPKLDDDFAKQAGFESLDDMKAKIGEQLRGQAASESDYVASMRALDAVVAASTFELPKSMVESMTEGRVEEEIQRLREARTAEADIEKDMDAIRKRAEEQAIQTIKSVVTINEIADAEGLTVTEEDFEKEAAQLGGRYGIDAAQMAALIDQEGRRDSYEMRILREKALALLVEHADVTDKEMDREALDKEVAEENEE